jgi:hypothetical protein
MHVTTYMLVTTVSAWQSSTGSLSGTMNVVLGSYVQVRVCQRLILHITDWPQQSGSPKRWANFLILVKWSMDPNELAGRVQMLGMSAGGCVALLNTV